jgi:hypothetical protein
MTDVAGVRAHPLILFRLMQTFLGATLFSQRGTQKIGVANGGAPAFPGRVHPLSYATMHTNVLSRDPEELHDDFA